MVVEVAPEPCVEPGVPGVVLVSGDCHDKAAKMPPSTNNSSSKMLAASSSKRRRLLGLRPPRPPPPPLSMIGGTGGAMMGSTVSSSSAFARNVPASGAEISCVGSVGVAGAVGANGSGASACSISASSAMATDLLLHRKTAGTIAMRHRIIVVKKIALYTPCAEAITCAPYPFAHWAAWSPVGLSGSEGYCETSCLK